MASLNLAMQITQIMYYPLLVDITGVTEASITTLKMKFSKVFPQ